MAIKLIYGANGEGKTELSRQLEKSGQFALNADISQIKIGQGNNMFSDYYTRERKHNELMREASEKMLSDRSSIFASMTDMTASEKKKAVTRLKIFLEEINFNNFEEWKQFYDSEYNGVRPTNIELHIALDLYKVIRDHPELGNLSLSQIEAAILLKQLKDLKPEGFTGAILAKSNELLSIKQQVSEILGNDMVWLLENNASALKKIRENLNNLNIEEATLLTIKQIVVSSQEFTELLSLNQSKIEDLGNSIIFDQSIQGVIDDGKMYMADGNLSAGELVVDVLSAIIQSVHATYPNGVCLDDVLEKLDNSNLSLMISKLSDLDRKGVNNMLILTHNENTFEQTVDLLENEGNEIEFMKIQKNQIQGSLVWTLSPTSKPTLVFEKLHKELVTNSSSTTPEYMAILLFAKIFGRMMNKAGALGNNSEPIIEDRSNYMMYDFTSNNIKHYSNIVDLNLFNQLFGTNFVLPTGQATADSIWLLNKIKSQIPAAGGGYGLSFSKIHDYIDELDYVLQHEKLIYSTCTPLPNESKKNFAKRHWELIATTISATRPNLTWQQRNNVAHRFDYSLISIRA